MKTTVILGVVAVLLVSSFAADCPLDKQKQPKIYSDSVGLTAQQNKNQNSAQNLVYNYQFQTPFPTNPNVAIGLNQIQASQSPLLDIRVSNPRTSTNGIYFQAESDEQSKWRNLKINFMATTRTDMELGSTTIKTPVINPNDNSFNMIYNIKNNLPSTGLKAKSFLQGINVYSQNKKQIGIKQQGLTVSNKQLFFTFSSPLRSSIVRSLTISIVVFNIYTPGVLYADGIIDQNYVVSTTQITIPRHGINELRTYIVGINSFETSASQPISIYSAIDETFSLVIGPIDRTQIDFVSVSYLIMSVVDCGSCEGNPLLFDGICQPICPPGFKATKGRCVPQGCREGERLGPNGQCIPTCGKYEQYVSGTCVCIDGYYRINQVCAQCQPGFYYDFKQLTCKPLCGANSQYRQGRCYCNPGYFLINNRCQTCSYGTRYDTTLQKCVNICGYNQVFSPTGCVCANGFNRIDGRCSRCPYMMIYDPDRAQCVCQDGFDYVYGQCITGCRLNQVRINGNCECARGFYRIGPDCGICGPQAYYNASYQRCICKPNYVEVNFKCVPNCTADEYFKDGRCISYCGEGEYRASDGNCYCYQDYEKIDGVCKAKCGPFQVRINGVCKCIAGYYKGYSPICEKVNCPKGTVFDYTRADCITVCSKGQVYINGACVCQYGYNNNNAYGDCVPACTDSEDSVNGFCECKLGLVRIAPGVCVYPNNGPSVCPPGYFPIFNQCRLPAQCGVNEYWCGTSCSCITGYYRVNGTCVPVQGSWTCPPNSDSNGVNCLCKPGFFPVNPGTCEKCPHGTYWNGYACDGNNGGNNGGNCRDNHSWDPIRGNCYPPIQSCRVNQQWDGIRCRCITGYYLIQGACRQCPPDTVFDGFGCTKGAGNKICRDPYSIWNGYSCVCMPGYWPLTNGRCVSCPEDTYWDGTCCKPRNGQFIPLTTC